MRPQLFRTLKFIPIDAHQNSNTDYLCNSGFMLSSLSVPAKVPGQYGYNGVSRN